MASLENNIRQVNADFKAIKDKINNYTEVVEGTPTNALVDKIEDVYEAGQSSMIDESKIIQKAVSGNPVIVRDVSEIPHDLNIQLYSGTITDFSSIEVVQTGKNLVDSDDFLKPLGSNNQIYFDKQEDGSYKSTKNVTTDTRAPVNLPAGTYTVQAKIKAPKSSNYRIAFWTEDGSKAAYSVTHDGENFTDVKYTLTTDKPIVAVGFYYSQLGIIEFKDLQIEYNAVVTPYEPYIEYRATADSSGIIEGLRSISPKMSIYSNADVDIELTYNKSWGMDYENKAWWDNITRNGTRKDYEYGFYNWNCEYLHPPIKIIPEYVSAQEQGKAICMFASNRSLLRIEKEYFDLSKCTYSNTTQTAGQYCIFRFCSKLKYIEDIGIQAGYMYGTYMGCSSLETIEIQRINKTVVINANTFQNCTSLKNITFEGEIGKSINFSVCPLSKTSITNIVEHLCADEDVTGQTLTLKESAVNEAFGIDASDTTTWTEEWINLIRDKSNSYSGKWNISFV